MGIIYVNPASADDTGDGTTPSTDNTSGHAAKKTLTSLTGAYSVTSDGDTIKLVAGTYAEDSLRLLNRNVVIEPNAAGKITMTRSNASAASSWFRILSDITGYNTTFRRINFVDEKAAGTLFLYFTDSGANYKLEDCSFTVETDGRVVSCSNAVTADIERRFTMVDCTLNSGSYTERVFDFISMTLVDVKGGTFTNASTTSTQFLFYGLTTIGPFNVRNATINAIQGVWFRSATLQGFATKVESCNLTAPAGVADAAESIGVKAGDGSASTLAALTVYGTVVTGCEIQDYSTGIELKGDQAQIINNIIDCKNPVLIWGGLRNYIYGNTKVSTTSPIQGGRCIMFGRKWVSLPSSSKANTSFTGTTVTDAAAWDLSKVAASIDGLTMVIVSTSGGVTTPAPVYYGIVNAVDDGTNTVTVNKWITVADGVVDADGPADATYFATVVRWSSGNYVVNNIFDSSAGENSLTFDFNPLDGDNIIDYNCYQGGSDTINNLGASDQTTLAAVQAKWLAWPMDTYLNGNLESFYVSTSTLNDANSLEEDPQLDVNYESQNLNVLTGGKPDVNGNTTQIGGVGVGVTANNDMFEGGLNDAFGGSANDAYD